MVKQPAMEASEFTMSNEDFPALPGLSGPAPGLSAPSAPVPSSMDDLSGAPGALPNQLGGQPQGVIGSTISSSDMILQSTQQGKKIIEFFTFSEKFTTCVLFFYGSKILDSPNHRRRKYGRCSPNSLRLISYFGSIWELYVLDLKTKVFCRKENQLHFPMDKGLTVPK